MRIALPARGIEKLRARYWHVVTVWRECRRLLAIARVWRERVSVVRFAWLLLLVRGGDAQLRLRGITYTLSLSSGEFRPLIELYAERAYSEVPGFAARAGWTVLDVGANAGAFSARQAQRGARVIACEPNPDCVRRFSRTIEQNGLGDRVTLLSCAVGSGPGIARMRVEAGHTEMGRVEVLDQPGSVGIAIRSLDEIVAALGIVHVDLLKIDTEGFEAEVLRGAAGTLPRVDRVILEYHSNALLDEVSGLLESHGLRTTYVARDKDWPGIGELYAARG